MSTAEAILAPGLQMGDNSRPGAAFAPPQVTVAMTARPIDLVPPAAADLDALIRAARSGDGAAQESLYSLFKRRIFAVAWRHARDGAEAEDLLQDIFVKVLTHLDDVRDASTFPAWVHRIAVNTCYSHLRQVRAQGGPAVSLDDVQAAAADAPAEAQESAGDLRRPLEDAMKALPAGLRSVFVLHDVQGYKHEEIARMMGCTAGTSKSQLFKARLRLREILRSKRIM